MAREIVRALEPFSVNLPSNVPVAVNTGDLWWSDDPLVKGRAHLFGEVQVRSSLQYGRSRTDVDTETADSPPGGRRGPIRRRGVDTGDQERPSEAQPPALVKGKDDDQDADAAKVDKATPASAKGGKADA